MHKCCKKGHWVKEYRGKQVLPKSRGAHTQANMLSSESVAFAASTSLHLEENMWYADGVASDHMIYHRE